MDMTDYALLKRWHKITTDKATPAETRLEVLKRSIELELTVLDKMDADMALEYEKVDRKGE